MKNPILILSIIIVVAIVSFGAFILSQNSSQSDSMMKKNKVVESNEKAATKPTENTKTDDNSSSSRYIEYNSSALESLANGRRVLFFYASWCPTCRPADVSFKENENKIPGDVTVIRVNYNDLKTDQEEKDLAKKYGVTYQHTFVQIDNAGKEVTKWNGGQIDELLSNIK